MPHEHKQMQDLMDRLDAARPKFGDWSSPDEMATHALALYAEQGVRLEAAQVQAFSEDVFKGVKRLPTTLPVPYVTPREQRWRKVSRWCSNGFMTGMAGIMVSGLAFTFFGPDKAPIEVPAMIALISVFAAIAGGGALGSLFFALLGLPGSDEEHRRAQDTMRQLLDASSTCAIEDLLRNPDRTKDVEALALEALRRRQLRTRGARGEALDMTVLG